MHGRFNYLLAMIAHDAGDAQEQREWDALTEQCQRRFNSDLNACTRASAKLGIEVATPRKRPQSATDYAALQLAATREQNSLLREANSLHRQIGESLLRLADRHGVPSQEYSFGRGGGASSSSSSSDDSSSPSVPGSPTPVVMSGALGGLAAVNAMMGELRSSDEESSDSDVEMERGGYGEL